ncbi:MAG TPA: hypothetical protein ENF73_02170 [Proteobacteria bacterium]|nr:hypothetical protein [Pseudomonadota bacterium]
MLSFLKKALTGCVIILCSILAGLLIAEGIVRVFKFDWRYIKRLLYYQMVDLDVFQPDPRFALFYRLKPNSKGRYDGIYDKHLVTVNSLGFRGREYSVEKPEGVFRIICLGGSNVYGFLVDDSQTWPAQLEAELNFNLPQRKFEVWNLGACAYVGCQMAILAREAAERYDPDLVILALSNQGSTAFLNGSDVEWYFKRYPILWHLLFSEESLDFIPKPHYGLKLALAQRSSLFRLLVLARAELKGIDMNWQASKSSHYWESMSIRTIREFIRDYKDRMHICIFICPAVPPQEYRMYHWGLDVPVFELRADGLPDEYREIHPPPYVMTWYAEKLAEWLMKEQLLEPKTTAQRQVAHDTLQGNR